MDRKLLIGCGGLLVLGLLCSPWVNIEFGQRNTAQHVETYLSAGNRPDGSRVFEGSRLLLITTDPLAQQVGEQVAEGLSSRYPHLAVETASSPYSPSSQDRRLPGLLVTLDTRLQESSGMLRRQDEYVLNLTLGRSPKVLMDDQSSPLACMDLEVQVEVHSTFTGFPPKTGVDTTLVGMASAAFLEALEDQGWEAEPNPQSGQELASSPARLPASPPLDIEGERQLIYAGLRGDGATETLWFVDTAGSFTAALETLDVDAKAAGWERTCGHTSAQGRPVGLEFSRQGEQLQCFPAHQESKVRMDSEIRERLAIVYRQAPAESN